MIWIQEALIPYLWYFSISAELSNESIAGHYVIENVAEGTYDYMVEKAGYHTAEGTVDVDGDVTVEVTLIEDEVSVPEIEGLSLKVYPNPAQTTLYIEADATITEIRMIDMLGQLVYGTSVGDKRHEIQVGNFKTGMYFIQVATDKGVFMHRVQVSM